MRDCFFRQSGTFAAGLAIPAVTNLFAEPADSESGESPFGKELELFDALPEVISSGRQLQTLHVSSATISVLDVEDIHYSGSTTVPELLQFVPGLDVLKIDRNRAAIGARGLHQAFADRTIALIDGRNASSPIFGGPDFYRLPLFVEDIERIEIVRGPGSAAWGANALNGVINIITKEPEDVRGLFATTTLSDEGDNYTQLRWAGVNGDWAGRISAGYLEREATKSTVLNTFTLQPAQARDFTNEFRLDSEIIGEISEDSKVSFGAGYTNIDRGDFEMIGFFPGVDERLDLVRLFARMEHSFADGVDGYIQWFGNFENVDRPTLWQANTQENDLEGQLNFELGEHHVSLGGNVRWLHLDFDATDPQQFVFANEPYNETFAGLFLIDRWELSDRFTFEGQIRGDYYSETETDYGGRGTLFVSLDDDRAHILKIAGARAFRTPMAFIRRATVNRVPLPPPAPLGTFFATFLQPINLKNESVCSFEVGYSGIIKTDAIVDDALTINWRIDGYHLLYEDLIGANITRAGPAAFVQFANIDGAKATGVEAEIGFRKEECSLSLWYTYEDFETDQANQNVRALAPADHKAGATLRYFLPQEYVFNLNYKYSDNTENRANFAQLVRHFNQVDIALSKSFNAGKAELQIGASDIFNDTEMAVQDPGTFVLFQTPGRILFLRLQFLF